MSISKKQRPAKTVPEAIFGMDRQAKRRFEKRTRLNRPLLKWQVRFLKWIKCPGLKFIRDCAYRRLAPSIQRLAMLVRNLAETLPHGSSGIAEQQQ